MSKPKKRYKRPKPSTHPLGYVERPEDANKLRRRQATRLLNYSWPFLLTAVPGRGLVKNVIGTIKPRVERRTVTLAPTKPPRKRIR